MVDAQLASETRSSYLLDGRRVTLTDLIDAQLIEVGERLRFNRPQKRSVFYAQITESGGIRLDDGQEFKSPSRAAVVAAGMGAVDGWHAWVVDKTGSSLDEVRRKLLDSVVTRSPEQSDNGRRHTHLEEARTKADAGQPVETTVRDLIALWGAKSRGHRLDQRIEADLANHGLTTAPNFRKVTLDTPVQMFALASRDTEKEEEPESTAPEPGDTDELDVGLTVGNLPSALGGVVSVAPNSTIQEAITIMLLNDYSQLAVMSGKHSLRGAITWKSIAQARHANPEAAFADATIEAHEAGYDKYLVDVLPTLEAADFIFVRDEKQAVAGIVTNADVVHKYGELATPFLLIGELDQALRYVVSKNFSMTEVSTCCDADGSRALQTFDELTMGDYQRMLENRDNWVKIGWPLERSIFVKRLDELREIRNDIMHFNPDPVPLDAVAKLRGFTTLLRSYCD